MSELITEYPSTADRAAQYTLIHYGPQHWRLGPVHDPLTFQPGRHMLADLFIGVGWLTGPEQRPGITFGLQQPGNGQRIELADAGRLAFAFDELAEPGRVRVHVAVHR